MTETSVEVWTNRSWHANPRLGELIVYLDGRNVGRLPRPGRLLVPCESGDHMLRIRQWWYLSPRLPLALTDGEQATIEADFACRDSLSRRFLRFSVCAVACVVAQHRQRATVDAQRHHGRVFGKAPEKLA